MFTMSDADVTMPCCIVSMMPRLTLSARPRSSALTMSRTRLTSRDYGFACERRLRQRGAGWHRGVGRQRHREFFGMTGLDVLAHPPAPADAGQVGGHPARVTNEADGRRLVVVPETHRHLLDPHPHAASHEEALEIEAEARDADAREHVTRRAGTISLE